MRPLAQRIFDFLSDMGPQYGIQLEAEFGRSAYVYLPRMIAVGDITCKAAKSPGTKYACKIYSTTADAGKRPASAAVMQIPEGFNPANPFQIRR